MNARITMKSELGQALQVIGRARRNLVWTWPGGVTSGYQIGDVWVRRPAVNRAIELELVVGADLAPPATWQCVAYLSQRGMVAADLAAGAPTTGFVSMRDVMRRLENIHTTARAADDNAVKRSLWDTHSTLLRDWRST